MKKILRSVSKMLLVSLMAFSIVPAFAIQAFAEDNTTTETTVSDPTTVINTDSKDITINSDQLVVDKDGNQTEQKDTTITTTGETDQTEVTDDNGNKANVVSTSSDADSKVTLDANGNPVSTTVSSSTTNNQTSVTEGNTTTVTTTDTTVTTTETTTVDQDAIDEAGKVANEINSNKQVFTFSGVTADGISYETVPFFKKNSNGEYTKDVDHYELAFTIASKAEGDQTLPISDVVMDALDQYEKWYMPGDTSRFLISVKTGDDVKHTYQYKDNSLVVESPDIKINEDNASGVIGYDGKEIPDTSIGAFLSCKPIQVLFDVYVEGKNNSNKVSLEDKLNVYDKLAAKGYTKENSNGAPLTAYLLDYYSNKDGVKYTTVEQLFTLSKRAVDDFAELQSNAIYTVEKDYLFGTLLKDPTYAPILNGSTTRIWQYSQTKFKIQMLWPEEELMATSYNLFYQNLYATYFGDDPQSGDEVSYKNKTWSQMMNDSVHYCTMYGVGRYTQDSELYQKANVYIKNQLGLIGNSNQSSFTMLHGINGYLVGNTYQNFDFSFKSSLVLEQVDGGISINKTDANGNIIGADNSDQQTGFNLYVMSKDGNGEKQYYALDENGVVYYTTDITKAALLMTENGNLSVQYLLPNTYYLQEVIAPEGYYINKTALELEVKSGNITEANFTDITPITTTTSQTETVVKTTVSANIIETPTEPERPLTPETPFEDEPKVEEVINRPSTPSTGDQTNTPWFAGILSVSLMCVLTAVGLKKKYSE